MKTLLSILIGLGCLILSALMVPAGIMALVHDKEFDEHGIRTTAVIESGWSRMVDAVAKSAGPI